MIKPIKYFNVNQCPKCFGLLNLIEETTTFSRIGDSGEIMPDDSEYIESKLFCDKCGESYDVEYYGLNHEKVRIKRTLTPVIVNKGYNPFYKDK